MRESGMFYIIIAAMLWGTTGTAQALAPQGATPLAISALRLIVAAGLLVAIWIWQRHIREKQNLSLSLREIVWLMLAGGCLALYQLTFFAGVLRTGVAVGTLVAIGSAPIFAGIFGAWLEADTLTTRWYIATVASIVGCGLLVSAGQGVVIVDRWGIALALGAGLSYVLYTVASKRLLVNQTSETVMAFSFAIGAILLSPLLFFVDISWALNIRGLLVIGHLGGIATAVAYMLFGYGLRTVSVSRIGTLTLAEPLTATLLGILLLHEPVSPTVLGGCGCILCGLLVLTMPHNKRG